MDAPTPDPAHATDPGFWPTGTTSPCTTTCYVDATSGSDSNDGSTSGTAFASIAAALDAASSDGTIIVAHNARFDVGFLRHFAREQDIAWPDFEVLDTVKLARHVVGRDEAPNHKLSSLARVFRAGTDRKSTRLNSSH